MAGKKIGDEEIDLDNMDFDDEFDFDIPDFEDPGSAAADRTPVENLSKGFQDSFVSHLTSTQNLKHAVGQAMPRGYAQAINVYDNASETAQELYNSVTSDIKPFVDSMRLSASKISPKIKDKLPKALSDRLDSFAADYDGSGPYNAAKFKKDGEESEIASTIANMFKEQAGRDTDEYVSEKADDAVRDVIEKKRHTNTMEQGNIVAQGISRLVGYQDDVLANWQRKTLELQYRQFFVAKDLLDVTNINTQKIVEALGLVVTNTALPEAVKIHKSEMASQMLKERMISNTFKTAANYTRDFRQNLTKNITDVVKGFSSSVTDLGMAGDAMDMNGGVAATAGMVAGEGLAKSLTNRFANFAAPYMDKFKGIRRTGAKIGNYLDDIPVNLNEWAHKASERDGLLGDGENVAKALIPKFSLDNTIASSNILDSDRPATFDNLTRRSIIEIIPGWLRQINRWTKATATGKIDDESKMDVYNLSQGKFTTSDVNLKDVKRSVNFKDQDDSTKRQLDSFIDKLEGDVKTLSPEARKALKKRLVTDAANVRKFDPGTLAKRQTFDGLAEEDVTAITNLFKKKFGLDFNGEVEGDIENEDLIQEFTSAYSNIRSTVPNTADRVRLLHQVLGKENFDKLGLSSREGNRDIVNHDKIFSDLAGYETDDTTVVEDVPAAKRKRVRNPRGPNPVPRPVPVPQPLQDITPQFDNSASNEQYLGKDSALLQLLSAMHGDIKASNVTDLAAQSASILGEIALRVNSINAGVPVPLSEQRRDANWLYTKTKNGLKASGTFTKDLAKGYFNKTMKFYKSIGSLGLWSGKLALKPVGATLTGMKNFVMEKARPAGLYIKGMKDSVTPKLTQAGIDAKTYWDVNSKKFITKMSDITGEVLGPDGKPVLTAIEFAEGLVTSTGKTLKSKIGSGIASVTGFMASAAFAPYKAAYKIAKGGLEMAWDKTRSAMDLYLKGENIARLRKTLMEKGNEYFDAVTGDPIKTIADIKGAVKDKYGDVVVTLEDIAKSKGFWSVFGKAVKTGGLKLMNLGIGAVKLAGQAAMLPFKAVMFAGRKLKAGIKRMAKGFSFNLSAKWNSTGDNGNDSVTLQHAQLAIQEQMLQFMRDRFGKKKGISGDADGDGDRDGSIKDMMANRKAMKDAKAASAAAAMLPKFDKDKKGKEGEEEGPGILGAGLAGAAGAAALSATKRMAGSAASWVGKKLGGQAIKTGLMTAGRFIGRQVLWRGAQLAGTALIGILGAPVALGALAVGAVGYGAYKLYKHIADKPQPLAGMRYAQYGINPREAKQISMIAGLEEMVVAATSIDANGAITISKSQMDPEAIFKLFDIDPRNEDNLDRMNNLTAWIAKRFLPVYNAHAVGVHRLAKGVTLKDIDKDLPIQQGVEYVKATRLDALEDVFDDTDTSPFEDDLESDADDVEDWADDAIEFYEDKMKSAPASDKKTDVTPEAAAAIVGVAASQASSTIKKIDAEQGGYKKTLSSALGLITSDTAKIVAMAALPGFAAMAGAWKTIGIVKGKLIGGSNKPKVQLDALTAGRYKAYGLVDLDIEKVEALVALEEAMFKDVFYDAEKRAYYAGKVDSIYPLASALFKIDDKDADHRTDWFEWFRSRYMAVFTQFCTSVRAKSAINAADASSKLSLDQQHEVLVETSAARVQNPEDGSETSIWVLKTSPWKKYTLNTDEESVAGNIAALKTAGKREGFKDTASKVTDAKTEIELARRQEAMDKNGAPIAPGSESSDDDEPGFFSKTADFLFGGKDPSGSRNIFGGNKEAVYDANAPALGGGAVIQKHPGGGTGGDINAIPSPTGDGWAGAKNTIIAAANMVGFDAATAATVAAVESAFQPGVKAPTSSAGGYFQFIDSTWESTLKKHGSKYGLAPNASKYDGRANALMGMEFLKENQEFLEEDLDRPVADTDLYAAHFLGPHGARRFLKAAPGADARQHVGENVPGANQNIFYDKSRNARTVSGVYEKFNELLVGKRKMHDLVVGAKVEPEKTEDATAEVSGNATGDSAASGSGTAGITPVAEAAAGTPAPVGVLPMPATGATSAPVGIMPMAATPTASAPAPVGITPTASASASVGIMAMPVNGPASVPKPANVSELADKATPAPTTAPVAAPTPSVSSGTMTATAISQGKTAAAAQGIQPTASTGLTTPATMTAPTESPTPVALAAMAQKQSSVESSSLNTSIGSVKDIMAQQLAVQGSMDGKLSMILEELKVQNLATQGDDTKAAPALSTPSQTVTKSTPPPKPLGSVPISTARQQAS